jgi:NADH-quinone oxidoreductase subunit A
MVEYIPLLVMLLVSAVLALGMMGASALLGPRKPSGYKASAYECGMSPVGTARERFPIKFYLIAMLFIVFDIETIFLYPWAVTYSTLPHAMRVFELIEMAVFVVILFVGYFYILGKGALDWDESEAAVSNDRHDPAVRAPRPALRYGNEDSGPIDISRAVATGTSPTYGASSQEQGRQSAGTVTGSAK